MTKYMIKVIFLLVFTATFTLLPVREASAETTVTISNGYSSKYLFDDSYYTSLELSGGTVISLEDASSINSLYIEWDLGTNRSDASYVNSEWFSGAPGVKEWILRIDNTEYVYGTDGYLHEFVRLPVSGELLEIVIPEGGASLCGLHYIEGDNIPDYVQLWNPPHEEADLLVLSTHADDEILFFGGTIPYYAMERGLNVQVVYFTYHTQKCRTHELLNGLYYSGIRNYPVIGNFEDIYSTSLEHAKGLYSYDKALEFIVTQYRRFRPNVLVTHDLNGEYGHGVHMLTAHLATRALLLSSNPDIYPDSVEKYDVWEVSKAYLHLYPKNTIDMEWEMNLSAFQDTPAWDVIRNALNQYESQLCYYGESLTRNPESKYDCTAFGLYRSWVGPDSGINDFFENISPYLYKSKRPDTEASH